MNKGEGITLPNFNTYQVAKIIKTRWYWQRKRHKDQWDRTKNPDINPQKYTQLIFNKGKSNSVEDLSFQQIMMEQLDIHRQKNKNKQNNNKKTLHLNLTSYTENNSKWITNLKVKCKTITLLE